MSANIPGYVVGTWTVDTAHSEVGFSVRHMMVSKVRGRFAKFEGTIVTADDISKSSVTASVDLNSIDTNNEQRDNHIRSADFFEVEKYPTMTFASTSISEQGDKYLLTGDLTLHGVTKSVTFELEVNGFGPDPYGGTRAGFSAKGVISRDDFNIGIPMPMDGGGVVVGDKVNIDLEIEAILNK